MTSDTLQLFLRDVRRHPLLTARGGGRARQAHRARRPRGQGADGQLEPAPGGLAREEVPGPRAAAARPDPGGHPRADPRGREVRLAQGLQVLHLRDLLDPPGDPARPRQPGPHDPHPGPHRPARAQDRARRARAGRQARPPAHRRGGRRRGRDHGRGARGDARGACARSRASTGPIGAARATPRSATCSPSDEIEPARGGRDRPARRDRARARSTSCPTTSAR